MKVHRPGSLDGKRSTEEYTVHVVYMLNVCCHVIITLVDVACIYGDGCRDRCTRELSINSHWFPLR